MTPGLGRDGSCLPGEVFHRAGEFLILIFTKEGKIVAFYFCICITGPSAGHIYQVLPKCLLNGRGQVDRKMSAEGIKPKSDRELS